jgi:hypothetical protein
MGAIILLLLESRGDEETTKVSREVVWAATNKRALFTARAICSFRHYCAMHYYLAAYSCSHRRIGNRRMPIEHLEPPIRNPCLLRTCLRLPSQILGHKLHCKHDTELFLVILLNMLSRVAVTSCTMHAYRDFQPAVSCRSIISYARRRENLLVRYCSEMSVVT